MFASGHGGASVSKAITALGIATFLFVVRVQGHEHHADKIPEGEAVSVDPIVNTRNHHPLRWHVPVQSVAASLAILGYILGHKHKGRQFRSNIHAAFAPSLMLLLTLQVVLGIFLKLHIERGILGRIRKPIVTCHGIIGKLLPVAAWIQMLFGGITALGFCRGDHLGQCLAHFIMGSAFIGYGIVLTILLLVGQLWLRRTGRSQEFFDSLVIAAWGCVNTFTEHRWGGPWVHNDLQHTAMGIIWWAAGLVGIWLSKKRDGQPKRNIIPGMVILLTGYAMSSHPQNLPLSTMVHTVFGYTLMGAGLTRIIEIAFVLRDKNATTEDGSDPNSFQYLPVFLLYASGFLFMGATEEQMALLSAAGVTHVAYVLILYSIAFLLFLFVNMLLHLYATHAWPAPTKPDVESPPQHRRSSSMPNGQPHRPNGHVERQIRDAEEFELEGLMTDDDEPDAAAAKRNGSAVRAR
ncbi:hypothetical protein H2199_004487 [Coniosporium tulheliwenetii]|uniref:Uncharacterized protein n=1 Tax=Coniosporium tulheliwenetii TaxID=3383036 RepID=A0ACC2Z6R0_9PEZI|nr:hypothetical protein H2199_004487 [Cladosporium sp. JES 115]